ncbi:MAG: hypothetical protein KDK91_29650 [Gammaproteobacteria bacterium]|nr:hypothetical protein [Gammaproteobacteria bacterium]
MLMLPALALAQSNDAPTSLDALFGTPAPKSTSSPPAPPAESIDQSESTAPLPMGEHAGTDTAPTQPSLSKDPQSRDALFATEQPSAPATATATATGATDENTSAQEPPTSADALFGVPTTAPADTQNRQLEAGEESSGPALPEIHGFFQNELAYAYPGSGHFSKFKNTLQLQASGRAHAVGGFNWFVSSRFVFDPVYDKESYFSEDVEDDQAVELSLREAYADIELGDLELRLGRQLIVWGETPGVFVADIATAKDLREHIVQDFELLRIGQWAARAEYFTDDLVLEAFWIPFATVNEIGVAGSEFYPGYVFAPDGVETRFGKQREPSNALSNSGFGTRASTLWDGYDISLFYYTSIDAHAAFERQIIAGASPVFLYTPKHARIHQFGTTLTKDFRSFLLKAEATYTKGRQVEVSNLLDTDGLLRKDALEYIIGLDWHLADETNINIQFFQRFYPEHDSQQVEKQFTSGVTFLANTGTFHPDVKPQVLLIHSLDEFDWLLQAKLAWQVDPAVKLTVGTDIFEGPRRGIFGQYDKNDRVYYELRYDF